MNTDNAYSYKSSAGFADSIQVEGNWIWYYREPSGVNLPLPNSSYDDFEAASRAVLEYLHQRLGFSLWMMTRVADDNWIALQTEDHGYDVKDGDVFRWTDSFCSRMINGDGPQIACDADRIPSYAAAPIGKQIDIGAYVGVPITRSNGDLFGTLCGIDPSPQCESIEKDLPLLELLAGLLSTILESDLEAIAKARELDLCRNEAAMDKLTGLLNRNGWEKYIAIEEKQTKRYGTPLSVFILDVDGLKMANDTDGHAHGDELLRSIGACLRDVLRDTDIAARIGGDEFAILITDCNADDTERLGNKIMRAFTEQNINISVGWAVRAPQGTVAQAIAEADRNMYALKARRKKSRSG